jgi:AcrR family transcriptional regulator
MRAIARASLYTYFGGLDDIFTVLLLSSYGRLAEATAAAAEHFAAAPPADRAFAAILAHRRWALDHRNEFNLLFTDQLPDYAAPEGGPTVEAQTAVFRPMIQAFASIDDTRPVDEIEAIQEVGVVVWAAFHGAVMLEVNHHLDWLDDPAAAHEQVVRASFAGIGLPEPATDLRRRFERWANRLATRRATR